MHELRNSARMPLACKVRETNGDYMYSWSSADLSEDGLFLINKTCFSSQDSESKLTFTLPCGTQLNNVTARIVREERGGKRAGCAFEFHNLTEEQRMALKRVILAKAAS